jgi:hypothetical protein
MTRRARGSAILLLLALLGGGVGLPLFDALVFHSNPVRRPTAERILGTDGPGRTHIQVCQLSHALPTERSLGGQSVSAVIAAVGATPLPPSSDPEPRPEQPATSHPSRAPPSA